MSSTWDDKDLEATPEALDEVLFIDVSDSRNQKRATLTSLGSTLWSRNAGSGFSFLANLTDRAGFGLNTPEGKVHILSSTVGVTVIDPDADELVLENNGNVGYTVAPTISIPAPSTPATATGTAVLGNGVKLVTTGLPTGTGYSEGEIVNLTGVVSGSNDARGTVTVTAGVIQTLTVTVIGTDYNLNEALTIVGQTSGATDGTATATTTKYLKSITLDLSGQGYTDIPILTVADSGIGTGGTATVVLVNTKATVFTVTAGGQDYTSGTITITIAAPPSAVTATGTVNIAGGKVVSVTLTNVGSGYFNPPPLPSLIGGDGTGAGIDIVTLSLGTISSITITLGGTGMTFINESTQMSVLDFGHPGNPRHGRFIFDHNTERFKLINNGVQAFITDTNSNVAVSSVNTDFTDRFTVRSDASDIESKISIGDNIDRLKLGYDGTAVFPTSITAAQIMSDKDSLVLRIASRGNSQSFLLFYTSAGSALVERLRIDPSGNISIGATSSNHRLQITAGNSSVSGNALRIDAGDSVYISLGGGGRNMGVFQGGAMFMGFNTNYDSVTNSYEGSGGPPALIEWNISGDISFLANPSIGAGVEFTPNLGMIVKNGGNIGINILLPTEKLHVVGNGLFTGTVTSKTIVNKPVAPEFEGVVLNDTNLDGANGVVIQDHYAIVVSTTAASVSVIDIKNPDNPVRLGTTSTDTRLAGATNVFVVGNIAYVTAKTENRLVAVSIENKSSPTILGSLQDNTNFLGIDGIFVKGQYAYVTATTSNIFAAIDISNPAAMVSKGTFTEGTFQNYVGVYVKENLAFITSRNANAVLAIDIEDVTSMSLTGSFQDNTNLLKAESITVSGKYAYVVSSTANSLTVVNITNPAVMTLTGTTGSQTSLTGVKYLAVAGEYAYATSPTNDTIATIDLTTIASPTILGSLVDNTNIDGAAGIAVAGTFAYVAGPTSKSLAVYNIHGLNTSSATIGTAQIGTLYVTENAIISNSLHTDSLNVANNAMIGGQLSMVGMLYFDDFANFTHTDPTLNLNIKTNAFGGLSVQNADGSVFIGDGTGIADAFLPFIRMRAKNSLVGSNILGQIPDADDTGDVPVMSFNARNLSNTAIITRPLFAFENGGVHVWTLDADGITHESVEAGITAFATGGQASATLLTKSINEISTVATAADSVKLHSITSTLGEIMTVINNGPNAVDVFPNTGHFINGLAVNAAFTIAAGARFIFKAYSSTKWVTF